MNAGRAWWRWRLHAARLRRAMRRLSLRWRVSLLLVAVMALVLGMAFALVNLELERALDRRFDSALLARAQALAALTRYERYGVELEPAGAHHPTFVAADSEAAYAVVCSDRPVQFSAGALTLAWPLPGAAGAPGFADLRLPDRRRARALAIAFVPGLGDTWGLDPARREAGWRAAGAPPRPACVIHLAQGRRGLDDVRTVLDAILATALLLVVLVVLALAPSLVRRGLRPLADLDVAMRDIGPEHPARRLAAVPTAELRPLVARFNAVLARMDAGLAREREFAAGLAHELRTRLAELRALAEVEARYPSARDRAELLDEFGAIAVELDATVSALLLLTRIESGLEHPRIGWVALAPLLARLRSRLVARAGSRGVELPPFAVTDADQLRADPALLEIILANLLGNAVEYAPAGTAVTLIADARGVRIANPAPELGAADLARFGQRFWRKREDRGGHAGLGLALAAAAARAQELTLTFRLVDGVLEARLEPG
jgi:signal transduction histidine kinase